MPVNIPNKILPRQHEIYNDFLKELDKHMADIMDGSVQDMFEIRDIADIMHIHPRHLNDTIKRTTGKSACYYFEQKIMNIARQQLTETNLPIAAIAIQLTFDPSNFTKFFKRFEGITPKQYRGEVFTESLSH